MSPRVPLLAALATAALVTLAYQHSSSLLVTVGAPGDAGIVEGFAAPGMTDGRAWRWTTSQSRVRLRAAGQVAPAGALLRAEVGLPRWAAGGPRRVTFAIDGAPLGVVSVVSGFAVHEFAVASAHGHPGDWTLSLATEGAAHVRGTTQGVALGIVEVRPFPAPAFPALRTLFLTVLGVVALLSLLAPRLGTRRGLFVALGVAAAVAAGLVVARQTTAVLLPPVVGSLTLLLAVDWLHRGRVGPLLLQRLARPDATWVGAVAPMLAFAGLVSCALGPYPSAALGLSLAVCGLWLARARSVPPEGRATHEPLPHETLFVALVTLLAFAFRLYRLEDIPFAIFRDEARHGLLALRLLAEPSYRPLFVGPPINQPLPYFLAMAQAIRAFGVDLFALRIVSALAGALAVPLLFRLVREVLGAREAVVAALLLAVSSWHVSISRFAVNYVEPSLFSLPAYLLLWRALPRARALGIGLAALLVGLGQYTAHTAKPLLIVAAGLVADEVVCRLRAHDGIGLRKLALPLVSAAVIGLISVTPILSFVRRNPGAYLARAEQVSLWGRAAAAGEPVEEALVDNLRRYAVAFHASGDRNGRHHFPRAPLLDPVSGLGLLVGLGLVLLQPSSRPHRFLLLWSAAGLLPGILTVDAPSALRTVEAAPGLYAISALGLVALWRHRPRGTSGGWRAAPALVLAVAVGWNAWTYFGRMPSSPRVWRRFAPIATHLGQRLQALREDGSLPPRLTLATPRAFLDDPDTRYVLQFYWPDGLEMRALEDETTPPAESDALAIPNYEDYWRLVVREEPRYATNAVEAEEDQRRWEKTVPAGRRLLAGGPFPATDRPMFWLYLPVKDSVGEAHP